MLDQHGEMLQTSTMSVIGLVYENAQTILNSHTTSEDTHNYRQDLCVLKQAFKPVVLTVFET